MNTTYTQSNLRDPHFSIFNPDKQSPSNHTHGMVIKNFMPLKLNLRYLSKSMQKLFVEETWKVQ
jgi:hypothetical protein